jgi:hypothetical protein
MDEPTTEKGTQIEPTITDAENRKTTVDVVSGEEALLYRQFMAHP